MIEINSSYIPHIFPDLLHKEKGSLHLFLHPQRPRWAIANQLGWEIAKLCDGKNTIGSITSTIARRYGKLHLQVERDILEFIRSLERAKLLIPNEKRATEPSLPVKIKSIFLHLTNRCNLRCIHCYVGDISKREELKSQKIYDLIDQLASINGKSIIFSGGEPLLQEDWFDILRYASESLEVTLNTNGTLIDSNSATLLSQIKPHIQISLDGPNPQIHNRIRGKGTFEATIKGIHHLQMKGLGDKLIICMTLMKGNIAWAPEMVELVKQLGIPKLRFLPLHSQGRARSSWTTLDASRDEYLKWYHYVYYEQEVRSPSFEVSGGLPGFLLYFPPEEESWCGVGRRIVVDTNGDVYPCPLLMDKGYRLGNVNRMDLKQIEQSAKLKELTIACLSRKETIEDCKKCVWKNFCQASCPAFALLDRGTLWATDEYCDFRQKLYEDLIFKIARGKQVQKSIQPLRHKGNT